MLWAVFELCLLTIEVVGDLGETQSVAHDSSVYEATAGTSACVFSRLAPRHRWKWYAGPSKPVSRLDWEAVAHSEETKYVNLRAHGREGMTTLQLIDAILERRRRRRCFLWRRHCFL